MYPDSHIHLISFDIPYPANYGGAIDVYYKLKALRQLGVKVYLHCFQYGKRQPAKMLEGLCEKVQYYTRQTGIRGISLQSPYIVHSRQSKALLQNLLSDTAPILFEGLHTCHYLSHPQLQNRVKWVRMHNIEWHYYQALARSEKNWLKKIYFKIESQLLRRFEDQLQYAQGIFGISPNDCDYLQQKLATTPIYYITAFHSNEKTHCQTGRGNYALYHGNLSVNENHEAASFLLREVFKKLDYPLIIAGNNPRKELAELVHSLTNVQLEVNPTDERLQQLVQEAHINILPTFQATGIKLKLLNALYNGRFCLVNPPMVNNTGLEELCHIADSAVQFQQQIQTLEEKVFSTEDIDVRSEVLNKEFSNAKNGKRLWEILNKSK